MGILASIGVMNGGEVDGEATDAFERVNKRKVKRKMDFAEQMDKLVQNGQQQKDGEGTEKKRSGSCWDGTERRRKGSILFFCYDNRKVPINKFTFCVCCGGK
uniref:Uncharacterized protein n=1 Tax=Globodera rostochiensis TaxID=31243 RepID=A0A914GZ93_GLORO